MKSSNVKIIICICLAFSISASLVGCVERFVGEETDYATGDLLTPEMIESIFQAISTPVTEKYPSETLDSGELLLYWLEGGSVWHISRQCGSVSNADPQNLHSGNIDEALRAGKERGCKVCAKGVMLEAETVSVSESQLLTDEVIGQEDKYPKEYDENGNLIVYWVKNGSVWHVSSKCPSLSKSSAQAILCGIESDAQENGKERACKICSDEN